MPHSKMTFFITPKIDPKVFTLIPGLLVCRLKNGCEVRVNPHSNKVPANCTPVTSEEDIVKYTEVYNKKFGL